MSIEDGSAIATSTALESLTKCASGMKPKDILEFCANQAKDLASEGNNKTIIIVVAIVIVLCCCIYCCCSSSGVSYWLTKGSSEEKKDN